MNNQNQSIKIKDIILEMVQMKRRKLELNREIQHIDLKLDQSQAFLEDFFQNQAIQEQKKHEASNLNAKQNQGSNE